jgi:hypothetical protein
MTHQNLTKKKIIQKTPQKSKKNTKDYFVLINYFINNSFNSYLFFISFLNEKEKINKEKFKINFR